jgi:hypothetical protein
MKNSFSKIQEDFDGEDSCKMLLDTVEDIKHHILTVQNTTLDKEEEALYLSVFYPFMHTYRKDVHHLREACEAYTKNRTLSNLEECRVCYERAYHHLSVNLQPLLN